MNIDQLKTSLQAIQGISLRTKEPIHRHTPLRVGGPAAIWAWVANEQALLRCLKAARKHKVRWKIHWPFEDWLVRDGGYKGLIIRLTGDFEKILSTEEGILIRSAAMWAQLADKKSWLAEFECWPGSVGGLFDISEEQYLRGFSIRISYIKGNEKKHLDVSNRNKIPSLPPQSIPIEVLLRGPRNQPKSPPRSGTLFRNQNAKLSEALNSFGLSGVRLRQWRLSTHGPGLLVHLGKGSCKDVLLLTKGLQQRMKKLSGIKLELRPPIIGSNRI